MGNIEDLIRPICPNLGTEPCATSKVLPDEFENASEVRAIGEVGVRSTCPADCAVLSAREDYAG